MSWVESGFESHLRQLIFLWKKRVVSGVVVLCCIVLLCLLSHLIMYINKCMTVCTQIQPSLYSDTPTLRSLVISGQVGNEGGNGVIDPVLEDNPVIITFSFEAVCA